MVASVFVRTLAGIEMPLAANLTTGYTCPDSNNGVLETFTLLDYYVKMDPACMFPMQEFVSDTKKTTWYNYFHDFS